MDRLPEELIVLIAEFCDHASLKNSRLVDSRFNAAATPATFEHFYMGLFGFGVHKLERLAKSPLGKHIKKFTLYSEVLPNWSRESWTKAIDFRPPFSEWLAPFREQAKGELARLNQTSQSLIESNIGDQYALLPRHNFTEEQLETGYAAYNLCVHDQVNWRKNSLGLAFKEYFSLLPNVSEARVQCTTPFAGRTNSWPVWKSLRQSILVGPDDWMYSTDFAETTFAYLSGHAALSLLEAVSHRASFSGTKQLTTLRIHSPHLEPYRTLLHEAAGTTTFFNHDLNNLRVHRLHDAFRHLTHLSLHISHATLSARLNGHWMSRETIDFLKLARQLRSLDLRYGDDELSPDDDASQLETLFLHGGQQLLWPHITRLSLATNIPAEILINFLRNHSSTLKSLELRDMLIRDVDLALEQIPHVVQLEHVYMEQLWDDAMEEETTNVSYLCVLSRGTDFDAPYEKGVKAYLLGESESLPEIERDGGFGDVMDWEEDEEL